MISSNDYASTYKSILYTLKKYYTLAVTENFDCSIEEVDEAIDYENLLAKLNDNFLETHGIRDIEWLIYSLGLDGFSKKSYTELAKESGISREAVGYRIKRLKKHIAMSEYFEEMVDPELIKKYRN